ncbi:ABC transporter permease [Vagococcus xieshaowenii]|uniref:Putative hemin transport system permease protein HrtB n=1 Tax=Vagococcus xieshaowenii TaxID=2562451 RepID=A0AAJ5JL73_9ENTE|nr:ABC transporter permease [Vagococcus xieshaowenii]QCA29128.1 ABC transporter permease [Vagococcus xieshaowenii]TFZ40895.1 ABC transporter permease [Vagococcus xieshaowenii]
MYLAWNEIKRNKGKYTMITLIVLLITWLVFLLTGLGNGLNALNAAAIQNLNGDHLVFAKDSENKFTKSTFSGDDLVKIKAIPGVEEATLMGSHMSSATNETKGSDKKVDITVVGVTDASFIEPKVIEGVALDKAKPNDVIVDDLIKNEGYKLGDEIKISGSDTHFNIVGFVEKNTFNHLPTVWLPLATWQEMRYAAPGSDDGKKNPVNTVVLKTNETFNADKLSKELSDLQVATRKEAVASMPGYKEENGTIMLMLAFLVAISAVIIGVFFYVLTMQKIPQFGVMKAIGASNGFISKMVIGQVTIITLIGIILGALATYGIAAILPEGMPFALDNKTVLLYGLLLFAISLISTLFSVRQIVKVDPLIALGRVE